MSRKHVLPLAVGLALFAFSLGAASASSKPLRKVQFFQNGGAQGSVKAGSTFVGSWTVLNMNRKVLNNLEIDMSLPKQTIDRKSIYMQGSTHTVSGNRVRFHLKAVPARRGYDITINYKVNANATGKFCDKVLLHLAGRTADYSPPCVVIVGSSE